jgi:hypothetical protein
VPSDRPAVGFQTARVRWEGQGFSTLGKGAAPRNRWVFSSRRPTALAP